MEECFKQQIYSVIAAIPKGKVSTYGQIAIKSGVPGYARQVGFVLKKLPKDTKLPWHRVINSAGKISFAIGSVEYQLQRALLESEGVTFYKDRVNLKQFLWG